MRTCTPTRRVGKPPRPRGTNGTGAPCRRIETGEQRRPGMLLAWVTDRCRVLDEQRKVSLPLTLRTRDVGPDVGAGLTAVRRVSDADGERPHLKSLTDINSRALSGFESCPQGNPLRTEGFRVHGRSLDRQVTPNPQAGGLLLSGWGVLSVWCGGRLRPQRWQVQ
jgi:hypothetical protein